MPPDLRRGRPYGEQLGLRRQTSDEITAHKIVESKPDVQRILIGNFQFLLIQQGAKEPV